MSVPFPRNFYDGPTTHYEVGETIEATHSMGSIWGVIEDVYQSGYYLVRVDPSVGHHKPTVLINPREAIRPCEQRVNDAWRAAERATWEQERADQQLHRARATKRAADKEYRKTQRELTLATEALHA